MKEEWKPVNGFEDYFVSNLGNVKSFKKSKWRDIKLCKDNEGYSKVALYRDGIRNQITVHRLVALTFIPNPNNLPYINHKNEIKTDNRVENLEWCSAGYNVNYGSRNEKAAINMRGEKAPQHKLTEEDVIDIYKSIKEGASFYGLAKKYHVHIECISKIAHQKTWKHITCNL